MNYKIEELKNKNSINQNKIQDKKKSVLENLKIWSDKNKQKS